MYIFYLREKNQLQFTNAEIRRSLRVKASTLKRYNLQLIGEGYIKKIKGKKGQVYHYEIVDINEYQDLKEQINKSLENCLQSIAGPLVQ